MSSRVISETPAAGQDSSVHNSFVGVEHLTDDELSGCVRNYLEPACISLVDLRVSSVTLWGAAMNKPDTEECLKRAAECARQADAASDPELKLYLMKLALSWTQAAGEMVERQPEDA